MTETTAQKTARLRAAREARDGTPAERREEAKRAAAIVVAGRRDRRLTAALVGLDKCLTGQDRAEFRDIVARHLTRK